MNNYSAKLFTLKWQRCPDGYHIEEESTAQKPSKPSAAEQIYRRRFPVPVTIFSDVETPARSPLRSQYLVANSDRVETYDPFRTDASILRHLAYIEAIKQPNEWKRGIQAFACRYGFLESKHPAREDLYTWKVASEWASIMLRASNVKEKANQSKIKREIELLRIKAFNIDATNLKFDCKINPDTNQSLRSLYFEVSDLNTAIRLMCAGELTGHLSYSPCERENCEEWFKTRKGKRFCSPKCRMAASRQRRLDEP